MKLKYLIYTAIAIMAFMAGQLAADMYKDWTGKDRLYTELLGQKEAYTQISKNLAKLEIKYQKEGELHEKAKKEWAEVKKEKNDRIKSLSDATYLIGKHVERQNGPDYYFETKRKSKNYVLNELRLSGKDSPPIGYILIKSDGKVYKRNYAFEIQVKTLQTIDEATGRIKFYTKAFLISKETSPLKKRTENYKDFKNIPYPLEIVGGSVAYDPTLKNPYKNRFIWAPRLNGGVNFGDFGDSITKASLGVSFYGYGANSEMLKYKLLQLGIGVRSNGDDLDFHFVPVSMRPLPGIFKNTYIGPGIGKDDSGTMFFLNTSIGF